MITPMSLFGSRNSDTQSQPQSPLWLAIPWGGLSISQVSSFMWNDAGTMTIYYDYSLLYEGSPTGTDVNGRDYWEDSTYRFTDYGDAGSIVSFRLRYCAMTDTGKYPNVALPSWSTIHGTWGTVSNRPTEISYLNSTGSVPFSASTDFFNLALLGDTDNIQFKVDQSNTSYFLPTRGSLRYPSWQLSDAPAGSVLLADFDADGDILIGIPEGGTYDVMYMTGIDTEV